MPNKRTLHPRLAVVAAILTLALSACGGGSSGDGNSVSGTAMAPGGTVAMFEKRSIMQATADFIMPAASAEITGLQPVPGALVELIQVNNDGNQVGDVLASTQTSTTGDYQLRLPSGIDFAANLVLRITSVDQSQTLDAQVLTREVNIDPYSDFLLDKLVENGTQLDTLPINEALVLKGKLEEFDLSAGNSMAEMLAALEAATGDFMDQSIETLNNGEGDATTVAGDYHLGEFSLSLHDSDEDPVGTFGADLIRSSVSLDAVEGGNLLATLDNAGIDTWYNLVYTGSGPHNLYVQSEFEHAPESVEVKVDGTGALVVESDFEEEIEDCDQPNPEQNCFAWRFPASTARFEPVSDTGLYLGRILDAGVRYHQTADGVLDPNNKSGDEVFYTLALLAAESSGLTNTAMDGNYGTIGISAQAVNTSGQTNIDAFYSMDNFDGAGTITGLMFDGYNISRAPNTPPVINTDNLTENATYEVFADGRLVVSFGAETDSGFVADNGNLFAVYIHDTETANNVVEAASNGMAVGVKLPESTPNMGGKSYRLYNMMFGYGSTDTVLSSLDDGVLAFNNGSTITLSADRSRGIEKATDTSNIEAFSEMLGAIAQNSATSISNNGMFSSTLQLDAGEELTIDGFVSASGEMIVFRSTYVDGVTREVGLFIGSLI